MRLRYLLLGILLVMVKDMDAHIVRLYQEGDYSFLRGMTAGNQELLLPGDTVEEQILKSEKFFGSKNYTTIVCVKDGKQIGFITYQKEPSSNWFAKKMLGSPGVIQLLNVSKEYRRQGVGAALLTYALEDMRYKGFDTVMVQTRVANNASRALYEKHGFMILFPVTPAVTDCFYKCTLSRQ